MKRSILLLVVLLVSVAPAWATDKCGTVCDETWTASGNPYVLTCSVIVSASCGLTIDEGVEIRGQSGAGIWIYGSLDVNGSAGLPVILTSDASSPASSDWRGVLITGNGSATIDHAEISFAQDGLDVDTRGGTVTIDHVTASNNHVGMQVRSVSPVVNEFPTLIATHSEFVDNDDSGVFVSGGHGNPYPSVTINLSAIHSNAGLYDLNFSMENPHEAVVNARSVWWDTTVEEEIEARTRGKVDWCKWLDGPGGTPVRTAICSDLVICDETQSWANTTIYPRLLVDDVWVCPTGRLEIGEAWSQWRRGDDPDPQALGGMTVEGTLVIAGVPATTVFEADATLPQPGDWGGIFVESGGSAIVNGARIRDAAHGFRIRGTADISSTDMENSLLSGIRVEGGNTTLSHVYSMNNDGDGLQVANSVFGGRAHVTASHCLFTDNGGYGVEIESPISFFTYPEVTVNTSVITGNAAPHQLLAGPDEKLPDYPQVLDFRSNDWGATDPAAVEGLIHDWRDDRDSARVDWCGYLSGAPPSTPVRDVNCPDLVVCDGTARWDLTDKPYLLWDDIKVCPTGTLEIGPGVDIRALDVRLRVIGTLDVQGTLAAPVTFHSDEPTPAPGDWDGLDFVADSLGTIQHATVSHAFNGISVWDHSQLTLQFVDAVENFTGLLLDAFADPAASLDAQYCRFTDNQDAGVWIGRAGLGVTPALDVSITQSQLHSNLGAYDLLVGAVFQNAEELVINARNNWWGTHDMSAVASRIHDYADNDRSAIVDWCDVLLSEGGAPSGTESCVSPYICNETVTWDRTDQPYLITSRVHVCETGTLRIEPGVEVRSLATYPPVTVKIWGILDVGDPAGPEVTFTSHSDTPLVDNWMGLLVAYGGQATLSRTTIEYADDGIEATGSADVALNAVTLRRNTRGLVVGGDGPPTVSVTGSTITENASHGIYVRGRLPSGNPSLSINQSAIHGNFGSYDFHATLFDNPEDEIIDARYNWWGSADPAVFGPRIYDRRWSASNPHVDWCGFLDSPGGSLAVDAYCFGEFTICDDALAYSATDKPHLLVSDFYVCPTGSMRIDAGVEILTVATSPQPTFIVEGGFETRGDTWAPVSLTSAAALRNPDDWNGLTLRGDGSRVVSLANTEISFANVGLNVTGAAAVTLDGVVSRHNLRGLSVHGDGPPSVSALGSEFTENTQYGVFLQGNAGGDPLVSINQSSIHGNLGTYDLYSFVYQNPRGAVVNARNNWWGSDDPAVFGSRIYDQRHSPSSPFVDWCGYLGSEGAATPHRDVHCVNDYYVCGETVTWDLTDKPYQLVTDLLVCPDGVLDVGAGVDVRTAHTTPHPIFRVEGRLNVNGNPSAPVTFTSDDPSPGADDWTGLQFRGFGLAELRNTTITWADKAIDAGDSAQVILDHVTARQNRRGLHVLGNGPPVINAAGCEFTGNTNYGVYLQGDSSGANPDVTINDSSIHGNLSTYDFYTFSYQNALESQVNVRRNWWGSDDPAVFGSRIYDQRQSPSSPFVDWCDYLGSEGAAFPHRDVHCVNDYYVCGETATWDLTDKPYQLVTDLLVCPDGVLNVGGGVDVHTVHTTPHPIFRVEGILNANGNPSAPVTFTSDDPSPAADDWTGLQFRGSGLAELRDTTITWADRAIDVGDSAQVTLDHVTARQNRRGLHVQGDGPPVINAAGCTFTDNTNYGVYLQGDSSGANPDVTINDSSIHGNLSTYDFYTFVYQNAREHQVDVRRNWWGSDDPAVFGGRIYDQRHSPSSPFVDWCDYLGSEGAAMPHLDRHCVDDYHVCGEIDTWDLTDKPYQLVTDMVVCPSGTLEVGPGVEVRTVHTTPQPIFLVEGGLDVAGTPTDPTSFTSDDVVPAVNDWTGLQFREFGTGILRDATITWADKAIDAGDASQLDLDDVTARHNRRGLHVYGDGAPRVNAAGCSFTENSQYGVFLQGYSGVNPEVTLTRSSIHSNLGIYDLYTFVFADPAISSVWATDNWWGTTDDSQIRARIYDHRDSPSSPTVRYRAFGADCDVALGQDRDGDGLGDFEDNCPARSNPTQTDVDDDLMGDDCDPMPSATPLAACDGFDDLFDGYADSDGDGWGDPCDIQPTRDDSYPGAPELCDARDNDGSTGFAFDELIDEDFDEAVACGDCDDYSPETHYCLCENCLDGTDNDCDAFDDATDPDCQLFPDCIVLTAGVDPAMTVSKGECAGSIVDGPFEVIRGSLGNLQFSGGSVDLGEVQCVEPALAFDRVTAWSPQPRRACDSQPLRFFLARNAGDFDFGAASTGEPREVMTPDPPCP